MEYFLNNRVTLHCGDCRDVLAHLSDNSIDSVVTDPPYHLQSGANASSGFMGKKWDGGDIAFRPELWRDVLRVLKPGAHLLACGGTRTYHRMVCAVEDAGFEIRDCVQWIYGSGFPKSLDVSKAIDKAAGAEREVIGRTIYADGYIHNSQVSIGFGGCDPLVDQRLITAPATDAARQWSGFGTALKPAVEMIVLARKPLSESTVAANVLRWGTGALNINGCLVSCADGDKGQWPITERSNNREIYTSGLFLSHRETKNNDGRWPANVIHDGSDEVLAGFPETASGTLTAEHRRNGGHSNNRESEIFGKGSERGCAEDALTYNANSGSAARFFYEVKPDTANGRDGEPSANRRYTDRGGTNFAALPGQRRNDTGSAARFYYTAKADDDDRLGSTHPTVKPVDLMQYLCRLITPPRGLILDLFAGTGTTGEAAWREGFRAVLIEFEPQYQNDIRRRMKLALAGPDERKRESVKARGKPVDFGPLFANREAAE